MTTFSRFGTGFALTVAIASATALSCGSSDDGGGKVATGGTSSGGVAGSVAGGGSAGTGTGGIAQGGSAGVASGGFAGVSSGGFAGQNSGGSAGAINWGPYPAGPYGHDVGSTIADLHWEGFVNETGGVSSDQLPITDYGTDAMRKSGKPYGLIHVSAFT